MENTPGLAHILYIPILLSLGLVVGWIFGGRSALKEIERQNTREDAREQRRAERAARHAKRSE